MLEDEAGSNRINDAKNREDACLERRVMEGNNGPMRVKVSQPIVSPGSVEISNSQDAKTRLSPRVQSRMIQLPIQSRQEAAKIS